MTAPTVAVRGKYLYNPDGSRFFMKGIAFPAPLRSHDYNETGWIATLKQIKVDLGADINTIRLYRMDPSVNYTGFFNYAASIGVYVLVPLTSVSGAGILNRTSEAPKCYSRELFEYGVACLDNYMQYNNTLAGVVGNEVMNSLAAWRAAPCIKAYVRDLKRYMSQQMDRNLPLLYTAQDNGIGASITAPQAMRLTADYLSCQTENNKQDSAIDIFGINVESWCSSTGSFEINDDGTIGTYFELWQALHNTSLALVFAEMGCAHSLFNRDNNIADKNRDWKQIPVVLNQMSDSWSGFCAYAYDGNVDFNMFRGGPWNGRDVLEPTQDFDNFRHELVINSKSVSNQMMLKTNEFPVCENVVAEMESCCDGVFKENHIELYNVDKIPSYQHRNVYSLAMDGSSDDDNFSINHNKLSGTDTHGIVLIMAVVLLSVGALMISRSKRRVQQANEAANEHLAMNVQYNSIN